ncbi:MAG: YidC/Oxa1 family membrane protein insertase [Acidimicrobiia bacterium]
MDAIISPISTILATILAYVYAVIPNFGVAIIILTFFVMLLLFPLTAKQTKSMLAMQQVQPQLKAIQQKYKGDKQKLNEEMMKFYQENKINPLAGCLPLVVQMPILFGLFSLMQNPQNFLPADSKLFGALCQGADKAACGEAIKASWFPSSLDFLGLNLHFSALNIKGGFWTSVPYFVLVLLSVAAQYFQSVQAQRGQTQINKQMQIISRVMPLGFGVFSLNFPAGTVLYWLVSALARIGQQEIILRKITLPHRQRIADAEEEHPADVVEAQTTAPRPKKRKRK